MMSEVLPPGEEQTTHRWSHMFGEMPGMENFSHPIRGSSRIQYSSLAVWTRYIAVGTSSGAVHVFSIKGRRHLLLLRGERDGAVVQMAFSPDGKQLAYGTSSGVIVVMELNLSQKNVKPQRIRSSSDHKGAALSGLCWNTESSKVYAADNKGKVTALNVTMSKAKGLLMSYSEVIMKLESAVVQLDAHGDRVVASTLQKTYMGNTEKHQFMQIGQRPRDGLYGACFYAVAATDTALVYCSRPGSRLWEVDHNGNVLNTHQFKQLFNVPQLPVVSIKPSIQSYDVSNMTAPGPQSVAFRQLSVLGPGYLLAVSGSDLYVVDPGQVRTILWTRYPKDIVQLRCQGSSVYLLAADNCVHQLELFTVPQLLSTSLQLGSAGLCASLVSFLKHSIMGNIDQPVDVTEMKHVLQKLSGNLPEMDIGAKAHCDIHDVLDQLISMVPNHDQNDRLERKVQFTKTETGIYVAQAVETDSQLKEGRELVYNRVKSQSEVTGPTEWGKVNTKEGSTTFIEAASQSNHDNESLESGSDTQSCKEYVDNGNDNAEAIEMVNVPKRPESPGLLDLVIYTAKVLTERTNDDVSTYIKAAAAPSGEPGEEILPNESSAAIHVAPPCGNSGTVSSEDIALKELPMVPAADLSTSTPPGQQNPLVPPVLSSGDEAVPGGEVNHLAAVSPSVDQTVTDLTNSTDGVLMLDEVNSTPVQKSSVQDEVLTEDLNGQDSINTVPAQTEHTPYAEASETENSPSCFPEALVKATNDPPQVSSSVKKIRVSVVDFTEANTPVVKTKPRKSKPKDNSAHITDGPPVMSQARNHTIVNQKGGADVDRAPCPVTDQRDLVTPTTERLMENKEDITSPKDTIMAVRDRVTSTAKNLVQTFRNQSSRLSKRDKVNLGDQPVSSERPLAAGSIDSHSKSERANSMDVKEVSPPSKEGIILRTSSSDDAFTMCLNRLKNLTSRTSSKLTDSTVQYDTLAIKSLLHEWASNFTAHITQLKTLKDIADGGGIIYDSAKEDSSADQSSKNMTNIKSVIDKSSRDLNSENLGDLLHSEEPSGSFKAHDTGSSISLSKMPKILSGIEGSSMRQREGADLSPDRSADQTCEKYLDIGYVEDHAKVQQPCLVSLPVLPEDLQMPCRLLLHRCLEFGSHDNITRCNAANTSSSESDINLKFVTGDAPVQKESEETGLFMRQYLPYMDIDKVFDTICHCEDWHRRRVLWANLMDYLSGLVVQDECVQSLLVDGRVDQALDGIQAGLVSNKCHKMAALNMLFPKNPQTVVDFCANLSSEVIPLHVLYMCYDVSLASYHPETVRYSTDKERLSYWLQYILKYLEYRAYMLNSRVQHLRNACSDMELYWATLKAVLQAGPSSDCVKCSCGYPRPNAHLLQWKHEDMLQSLLTWPNLNPDQSQTLIHALYESGHWIGYLTKINCNPNFVESPTNVDARNTAALVLQLNDMSLLDRSCLFGYYPRNFSEWCKLLKLMVKQHTEPVLTDDNVQSTCKTSLQNTCQVCLKCSNTLRCDLEERVENDHYRSNEQLSAVGGQTKRESATCDVMGSSLKLNHSEPDDEGHSSVQSHDQTTSQSEHSLRESSWVHLMKLAFRDLGTDETLRLLQEVGLPTEVATFKFMETVFNYKVAEKFQGLLVHSMLEKIDTHLWGTTTSALPAQMMKAISMEINDMKHHQQLATTTSDWFSSLAISDLAVDTLEQHHCGIPIDCESACPVCGLKLLEGVSLTDTGLDVLPCGHGLHTYCLKQTKKCPICLMNEITTFPKR